MQKLLLKKQILEFKIVILLVETSDKSDQGIANE